ncbi:hypothetical protein [Streptomyces sp. SLBN-8D4]|uniref:hypothetical protein n=1 Tax=Streptomyces sp. SLBN-8D4 TaxID=3377728 RepID=UPI003C7C9ACA
MHALESSLPLAADRVLFLLAWFFIGGAVLSGWGEDVPARRRPGPCPGRPAHLIPSQWEYRSRDECRTAHVP